MPRNKMEHPTPAELEVLNVLWERGSSTVREVMESLESTRRGRAYTSVMSLMNLMWEKGLLKRHPEGRAFRYAATRPQNKTLGELVTDLCKRAFAGSASALVTHILEEGDPTPEELAEIQEAIQQHLQRENSK